MNIWQLIFSFRKTIKQLTSWIKPVFAVDAMQPNTRRLPVRKCKKQFPAKKIIDFIHNHNSYSVCTMAITLLSRGHTLWDGGVTTVLQLPKKTKYSWHYFKTKMQIIKTSNISIAQEKSHQNCTIMRTFPSLKFYSMHTVPIPASKGATNEGALWSWSINHSFNLSFKAKWFFNHPHHNTSVSFKNQQIRNIISHLYHMTPQWMNTTIKIPSRVYKTNKKEGKHQYN